MPVVVLFGLVLAVLLLAAAQLRREDRRTLATSAVLLLLAGGLASAVSQDGLTGDWTMSDQLASNGLVVFGKLEADELSFRVGTNLAFNSGPEAVDDTATTNEDTPVAFDPRANDSDPRANDSDPGATR